MSDQLTWCPSCADLQTQEFLAIIIFHNVVSAKNGRPYSCITESILVSDSCIGLLSTSSQLECQVANPARVLNLAGLNDSVRCRELCLDVIFLRQTSQFNVCAVLSFCCAYGNFHPVLQHLQLPGHILDSKCSVLLIAKYLLCNLLLKVWHHIPHDLCESCKVFCCSCCSCSCFYISGGTVLLGLEVLSRSGCHQMLTRFHRSTTLQSRNSWNQM